MANLPNIVFKPVELAIAKLDLKPGQVLVIEFPDTASREDVKVAAEEIYKLDIKIPFLLVHGEIKISVAEMKDG